MRIFYILVFYVRFLVVAYSNKVPTENCNTSVVPSLIQFDSNYKSTKVEMHEIIKDRKKTNIA